MNPETIFLYGPPGSGKTTVGRSLALALEMHFHDLLRDVVSNHGRIEPWTESESGTDVSGRSDVVRVHDYRHASVFSTVSCDE